MQRSSGLRSEAGAGTGTWRRCIYDTDLKSADAVVDLHKNGVPFSSIQKAFSVGTMGRDKGRHLVPTRWSITACDTIIGDRLLGEVKKIPRYRHLEGARIFEPAQ